jgi:hypothetical protein
LPAQVPYTYELCQQALYTEVAGVGDPDENKTVCKRHEAQCMSGRVEATSMQVPTGHQRLHKSTSGALDTVSVLSQVKGFILEALDK